MGAKKALVDKATGVAVCGDGFLQMSMMELATIRQHDIPIKIIVLIIIISMVRDTSIMPRQRQLFGSRSDRKSRS